MIRLMQQHHRYSVSFFSRAGGLREDIAVEIGSDDDVEFPGLSEEFVDHAIDDLLRIFDSLG